MWEAGHPTPRTVVHGSAGKAAFGSVQPSGQGVGGVDDAVGAGDGGGVGGGVGVGVVPPQKVALTSRQRYFSPVSGIVQMTEP